MQLVVGKFVPDGPGAAHPAGATPLLPARAGEILMERGRARDRSAVRWARPSAKVAGASAPAHRQLMQRAAIDPRSLTHRDVAQLQRTIGNAAVRQLAAQAASSENRTGLPATLRAGIENLSGLAMDDVRVHYNSAKPAQIRARAYTQGADIHVGPGHEKHLPHEAWHVVQQKEGRVAPTLQMKGVVINDDAALEGEASAMGAQALGGASSTARPAEVAANVPGAQTVIQPFWYNTGDTIMWIDDVALDRESMEETEAIHEEEDDHPAGPVWRLKADNREPQHAGTNEAQSGGVIAVDDLEGDWHQEGPVPGRISVKDLTGDVPALIGPTEAWGGANLPRNFGDLGWDQPLSQVRITRPTPPQTHVNFWCKVGNVDVTIHLTAERYALIYQADNAPGENDVDVTVVGRTGKDLYTEFLRIATEAGGYREGANECHTFANRMLSSLTQAVNDANFF